ncbi:MAG: hypothetical protein PsegKO_07240 [Pseudohongiellaceae bacterium]
MRQGQVIGQLLVIIQQARHDFTGPGAQAMQLSGNTIENHLQAGKLFREAIE